MEGIVQAAALLGAAKQDIMQTLITGLAITESTGIYALVISFLLIFLKG